MSVIACLWPQGLWDPLSTGELSVDAHICASICLHSMAMCIRSFKHRDCIFAVSFVHLLLCSFFCTYWCFNTRAIWSRDTEATTDATPEVCWRHHLLSAILSGHWFLWEIFFKLVGTILRHVEWHMACFPSTDFGVLSWKEQGLGKQKAILRSLDLFPR